MATIIKTPFGIKRLDRTYEIPYLAGYSKDSKTIYIDRRLNTNFTLSDGRLLDITKYLLVHEIWEKHLETTKKYKYAYAHEKATGKEREAVEADGYPWEEYQAYVLDEVKRLHKIDPEAPLPKDYDDTPERDSHDYYLLKKIHKQQKINKLDRFKKPHTLIQAENNPILLNQIIEEVGPRIYQIIETASIKSLDRYNLREGRVFGIGQDRYKIVQLCGNVVVYKDFQKDKLLYEPVNELLTKWNLQGAVEISPVDAIIEKIKSWLTPFLGAVLVAALISWLIKKLK